MYHDDGICFSAVVPHHVKLNQILKNWFEKIKTIKTIKLQCRGWGTDLVPPHMSQIYNQQMTLAEQVDICVHNQIQIQIQIYIQPNTSTRTNTNTNTNLWTLVWSDEAKLQTLITVNCHKYKYKIVTNTDTNCKH